VYVTWHELVAGALESSGHVVELNEPAAPLSLHETFAAGNVGEEDVSITAAVSVTVAPGAADFALAEALVIVVSWVTASEAIPELEVRRESPG
jgi:hypothetical protein